MKLDDVMFSESIDGVAALDVLLAKLYDGVTAPDGFQAFIELLARCFSLRGVALIVKQAETHETKNLWLHGNSQNWMQRYALDYAAEDVLGQHLLKAPIAHFYASNLDVALPHNFPQTRFYREWLAPQGIAFACGSVVLREGAWLTLLFLQRSAEQGEFSRAEMGMLDRLVPHMQRALQMRERFAEMQLGQDFLAGGLDMLAMPAMFFDEHSRLAHLNKRATRLLAENDLLWLQDGHLVARDIAASRKLNFEISNAVQASRGGTVLLNEVVLLTRPGRQPLMMMVTPVRLAGGQRRTHGAALVFAFDPEMAPSLTVDRVRKLFGLTKAEAELVVALCGGQTLDDIAHQRQVSPGTVRTQLKHIFVKTGTNRQTELVSMVLASPAFFIADNAG